MSRFHLVPLLVLCGALPAARAEDKKAGVHCEVHEKFADFMQGRELIARYHIGQDVAKPYFYPLMAPGGLKVTRGVPPPKGETSDHPHQKSAWFCHGDIIPEGIELKHKIKGVAGVDFWSEASGHGKIRVASAEASSDKGDAVLVCKNEWTTADGVKIMDETRTIRMRPAGNGYLFAFDIELKASVCPLTFGDTKEGSFAVRVPDSMTEKKKVGVLSNADGMAGAGKVWGQRSDWNDYSGPVAGKDGNEQTGGVAIFDHPSNSPRACWHSRDYGLMGANPFGRAAHARFPGTKDNNLFKLAKGETLKLRYGLFPHTGSVKEGKVAEVYEQFVKPK